MEALCDNGSGVDGDNGDIDDWDGNKNGNGFTLKQIVKFCIKLYRVCKFIKLYRRGICYFCYVGSIYLFESCSCQEFKEHTH